jgi:hypothetical protein
MAGNQLRIARKEIPKLIQQPKGQSGHEVKAQESLEKFREERLMQL